VQSCYRENKYILLLSSENKNDPIRQFARGCVTLNLWLERRWMASNHLDVAASLSYATSLFDVTKKDKNAGGGWILRHGDAVHRHYSRSSAPVDALPCSMR
jgi:hypothetical protein